MLNKIRTYIKTHIDPKLEKPILDDSVRPQTHVPHILVGLSGGPDSMFLLHVLKNLADDGLISLSAAHLNHGWRPEADSEEDFCKKACEKLEIPCFTDRIKNLSVECKPNGSKEEMGRTFRRHFFSKIKDQIGADYVALAHHQQDQQETFFIRLIRGCSLSGLTAIKPVQSFYIRPLLKISKPEILEYLKKSNIGYVVDESNSSDDFLRNRIRKYIIPALSQADPRFCQKFQTSLDALEQENGLLDEVCDKAFENTFIRPESGKLTANKKSFMALNQAMQKRVLIKWLCAEQVPFRPSTGLLEEIMTFISSDRGGTHHMHQDWLIKKQKQQFWIERTS